jgi:hypothetical protein
MKKVTMPNKYIKGLISLAMILLILMIFVPSSPVLAAPAINLIPSAGAVGTVVTINGTVFDSYKGDNVHIFFDVTEIENSPLTVPVQGAFSIDFTIPASANAGQHWIEVRSETTSSSMLAKNYFTVEATTLTLATPEGGVGTSVNIAGNGFYVNKPVTLYFMNITKDELGTTIASSTGKFTHQFVVPISTAGFHKIIASNDMGNSAEIQFKVLPKLKLNLDSAGSGDLVSASGTGFASRTTLSIIFGAQNIASTQTDELGNFEIDFNVPLVKPYSYNVRAQDNQGNTDTVKFTVAAGATLSETIGTTGSELTINGSGFLPGATVYIYYDNNRIASVDADDNGDFTATFIVPPGGGKHVITVYDGTNTKKYNFALEKVPPPMPTMLLPNNNSLTIAEVNFDWSDVTDNSTPVTYSLQIASDQNFGSLVLSKTGIRESHYTLTKDEILSADFNKAPYYWKIKAIDGADNESEWTSPWVFYVSVPSIPILVLPLPDAKVELPIRFSWQSTASLSLPLTYNLQIATNPDFASLILDKTGLTLSEYLASEKDDLKLENEITYYWKVKAIDGVGNSSDWSMTGSFDFIAPSGFPSWATYILITFGGLIALLLAFRAGRRTAYH